MKLNDMPDEQLVAEFERLLTAQYDPANDARVGELRAELLRRLQQAWDYPH